MGERYNLTAGAEWRAHWPIVLSSLFGVALLSVYVYSTGLMIQPLEQEFGWTRAQISSGPSIVAVMGCVAAPFMGAAIDRMGPRRFAIPGVIGYCSAIALLSQAQASIWSWWALWFVVGLTHPLIKPTVWVAAVSSMFNTGRGLALAAVMCGSSVSSALTPILTNYLIGAFGWRGAYAASGAIWVIIVLPLIIFGFYGAIDKWRTTARQRPSDPVPALAGMTAAPALKSAKFAMVATASSLIAMSSVAMTVNLVPILSAEGIDRSTAAWISGVSGLTGVVGKIVGGVLLDRMNAGRVVGLMTAMPAVSALLLIAFPGNPAYAIAAVALVGFALGVEIDGVAYLISRHFGLRSFGLVYGTVAGLLALATGLGPVMANYAYDVTGSYLPLLSSVIPLALLSSVLFLCLGPYPSADGET